MESECYHAILIGINDYRDHQHLPPLRYAEKDAQDLYEVLTDPDLGNFSTDKTTLLTGQEATTDKIREVLFTSIVNKPTANDIVLVYFSGHGFILGERPKRAYLATHDVDITTLLTRNMRAGLRMDELHEDIFMASPAKYVLFILDSCHSGAFVPSSIKSMSNEVVKIATQDSLVDKGFFSGRSGRVAIVSSPADLPSYESSVFQNSLFTHYLLEGLKGNAVEQASGDVSLDSLTAYVRNHMPADQLPGRYGQDYGRIVLAKPGNQLQEEIALERLVFTMSNAKTLHQEPLEVIPLSSPLASIAPFLENLMAQLAEIKTNALAEIHNQILEVLRRLFDAEFVMVIRQTKKIGNVKAQSSFQREDIGQGDYFETLLSKILFIVSQTEAFRRDSHGLSLQYHEGDKLQSLMVIPLRKTEFADLMIIAGLPQDSEWLGEIYGRILAILYAATHELTALDPIMLEATILDHLKQTYNFLPIELYNRRLKLFCERLNQMTVKFQPVLYLDPKRLHIDSWEALARSPQTSAAPIDLFEAAELWGHEFMIELDTYFLKRAVIDYTDALAKTAGQRRAEDMKDLSVNVYPESLMRRAYFEAVNDVIRNEKLIQPEKLILEISEKRSEPKLENSSKESIDVFKDRLESYIHKFSIGFAIDDFGVGHASISRLAGLNPLYVKIDRAILHQQALDLTLEFITKLLIRRYLRKPKIVIEGLDRYSPLNLNQLYQMGVSYVQGYIIGLASSEPLRLAEEDRRQLRQLLINDDSF